MRKSIDNEERKVIVLGASPNPERFSYRTVSALKADNFNVIPIGIKNGLIEGIPIIQKKVFDDEIDTVTLYLNKENQKNYYDYLIKLKPKRIIFNPGAENNILKIMAHEKGIQTMSACTLVLLCTQSF